MTPGELKFSASYSAIAVTASRLRYEYRLDGAGGWTSNGTNLTLTDIAATAGNHTLNVRAVSTSGVAGATATSASFEVTAASESVWQSQTLDDDWFSGSAAQIVSQEIQGIASVNVTKVKLRVYTTAGTADVKVQLRTAVNGGGSHIGADSDTINVDTNIVDRTFTFASPIAVAADFAVNVVGVSGSWRVRGRTGSNAYGSTTYAVDQGGSRFASWDLYFEIYKAG